EGGTGSLRVCLHIVNPGRAVAFRKRRFIITLPDHPISYPDRCRLNFRRDLAVKQSPKSDFVDAKKVQGIDVYEIIQGTQSELDLRMAKSTNEFAHFQFCQIGRNLSRLRFRIVAHKGHSPNSP